MERCGKINASNSGSEVVSLDSVDEHEQARSEDARYTLLMHDTRFASGGMLWSSPHATVLTHNAPITANAALALIWSVVEPIAAFHDCCAPCVRARFRCARGVTGAIKSHSFIIAFNIKKLSFSMRC